MTTKNCFLNRTLPHLLPTIRDMVQVQRLASMRPSEVCRMKPEEIDTGYKTTDGVVIWMYTPGTHKNSWREKRQRGEYVRIIPLGKPEQDIIALRLLGKSDDDYIFSPKDTVKERYARDALKRKTKVHKELKANRVGFKNVLVLNQLHKQSTLKYNNRQTNLTLQKHL